MRAGPMAQDQTVRGTRACGLRPYKGTETPVASVERPSPRPAGWEVPSGSFQSSSG